MFCFYNLLIVPLISCFAISTPPHPACNGSSFAYANDGGMCVFLYLCLVLYLSSLVPFGQTLVGLPLFFRCLVFLDTNLAVPSAGTQGGAVGLEAMSSVGRQCTGQRRVVNVHGRVLELRRLFGRFSTVELPFLCYHSTLTPLARQASVAALCYAFFMYF